MSLSCGWGKGGRNILQIQRIIPIWFHLWLTCCMRHGGAGWGARAEVLGGQAQGSSFSQPTAFPPPPAFHLGFVCYPTNPSFSRGLIPVATVVERPPQHPLMLCAGSSEAPFVLIPLGSSPTSRRWAWGLKYKERLSRDWLLWPSTFWGIQPSVIPVGKIFLIEPLCWKLLA